MNKLSIILSTIVLISSACSIDQTGQHMKLNEPMPPIALKKDSVLEADLNSKDKAKKWFMTPNYAFSLIFLVFF